MATGLAQNEKLILSSIDELRKKRNKRPDKESVSFHPTTKLGLGMAEALETIDSLIEEEVIEIKKTDKVKMLLMSRTQSVIYPMTSIQN